MASDQLCIIIIIIIIIIIFILLLQNLTITETDHPTKMRRMCCYIFKMFITQML